VAAQEGNEFFEAGHAVRSLVRRTAES
jgi:hypothetical protein